MEKTRTSFNSIVSVVVRRDPLSPQPRFLSGIVQEPRSCFYNGMLENSPEPARKLSVSTIVGRGCVVMVCFLGIACFALSFEALRDLAVKTGALPASVAWVLPIIVDGAAVIYALSAFRASIAGSEKDRRWFFSLVVIITLVSVGLNVAHASKGLLPALISALPPVLLFAAFESLLRGFHPDAAKPGGARKRKASPESGKALSVASDGEAEFRRAKALSLAKEGLSQASIARELGVSAATVSRYLGKGSKAA